MIQELKTLPDFFMAVARGEKTFEVRKNDRNFQVGDDLYLREWSETTGYTGRKFFKRVSYVLTDPAFGVQPGFAVLGLKSA